MRNCNIRGCPGASVNTESCRPLARPPAAKQTNLVKTMAKGATSNLIDHRRASANARLVHYDLTCAIGANSIETAGDPSHVRRWLFSGSQGVHPSPVATDHDPLGPVPACLVGRSGIHSGRMSLSTLSTRPPLRLLIQTCRTHGY